MDHQPSTEQMIDPNEEQPQDPTFYCYVDATEEVTSLDFSYKHPLQNSWTMYYDNPGKRVSASNWEDNLRQLYTFDTVEDFWSLQNSVVSPSKLSVGSNYHLFKAHIAPKWEDPCNAQGGKWVVSFPGRKRKEIDDTWLNTMLALIGEAWEEEDEICGAVVSIRKDQDRISVWTRTSSDLQVALGVGRQMRTLLEVPESVALSFHLHQDSMKKNSSYHSLRPALEC
eukprot:CAMPEP_0184656616 /NCGR_PEP_ID=MMETSP0308-20130426/16629_1 /TAXON_ID=38269 /ORGANISM="Gloeochaete witrockiana, Strain SAG 46.84" /LENGTH=225 /DNA_ID=CAMNT_0027093815 /DNA_START=66 /DNA_END=743 /DNA_ORIENTATION=-